MRLFAPQQSDLGCYQIGEKMYASRSEILVPAIEEQHGFV